MVPATMPEKKPGRPYFSPRLVGQIESFFAEEGADVDLTEFAQDAAKFYLQHLKQQRHYDAIIRLADEGKLSRETAGELTRAPRV